MTQRDFLNGDKIPPFCRHHTRELPLPILDINWFVNELFHPRFLFCRKIIEYGVEFLSHMIPSKFVGPIVNETIGLLLPPPYATAAQFVLFRGFEYSTLIRQLRHSAVCYFFIADQTMIDFYNYFYINKSF